MGGLYCPMPRGSASSYFRAYLYWYPEDGETRVIILDDDFFAVECVSKLEGVDSAEAVTEDFRECVKDIEFIRSLSEGEIPAEGCVEIVGEFSVSWSESCYPDSQGEIDSETDIDVRDKVFLSVDEMNAIFDEVE